MGKPSCQIAMTSTLFGLFPEKIPRGSKEFYSIIRMTHLILFMQDETA